MSQPSEARPTASAPPDLPLADEADGGLIGIASTVPITGCPLIEALARLRWRGNGLGGGVALVGCFPRFPHHYALNIALLQSHICRAIENEYVAPHFDVADVEVQPELDNYRQLPGLGDRPPLVVRYFVRVRPAVLERFARRNAFADLEDAEDEFVYQNSLQLNKAFYAGHGDKLAFVLSHGRDMMILKAAGYAEDVARFYRLDEVRASVWLGHQGFLTRAGASGANPFPGLDEALALSGDFANCHSLAIYVRQRGHPPLFQSDAELAAILFDFYSRACAYPLELTLEALAPTAPVRLARLPSARRRLYRTLQHTHAHGTPEGPAFFALARNVPRQGTRQLVAAVDAEALRPNVFALQEGILGDGEPYGVGMVASERQAIDAAFAGVAEEHEAVCPFPDKTWTARGRSESDGGDGGAYIFSLKNVDGRIALTCTDKFGRHITADRARAYRDDRNAPPDVMPRLKPSPDAELRAALSAGQVETVYDAAREVMGWWTFAELEAWLERVAVLASAEAGLRTPAVQLLTLLHDRFYDIGSKKRSAVLALLRSGLTALFNTPATVTQEAAPADPDRRLTRTTLGTSGLPEPTDGILYIDAANLPLEGADCLAHALIRACQAGWRRLVLFGCKGDRFVACGLGRDAVHAHIDIFGTPGDYLAAGLDGAEVHVHGPAQGQAGHLMRGGRLVIYGDVGQTFLYGATGGEAYVLGNVAERAFGCAGGELCAVVNGRCADFAAQGCRPGTSFICINGLSFQNLDDQGRPRHLSQAYAGLRFFSEATDGTAYLADPVQAIARHPPQGAVVAPFGAADRNLLLPRLTENAALFGLPFDEKAPLHALYTKLIPTPCSGPAPDLLTQPPATVPAASGRACPAARGCADLS